MNERYNPRIYIENSDLRQVFQELKAKNYSLKTISEKIGVDFKGPLYRGYSISEESYKKLKALVEREIPYRISNLTSINDRTSRSIQVEQSVLREIIEELRERGFSQNFISQNIGTQIGNALHLGYSINEESFNKLVKLYRREIPHSVKNSKEKINNSIELEENNNLAELIGIILGDGHLHKKGELKYKDSVLSISLNRVDESEYVNYIRNLLKNIFKVNPELHPRKESKGIDIKLYGDGLIDALVSKGLQTGDKVRNQVSVPLWIKIEQNWIENNLDEWNSKYKPLVLSCIKGLVDTDGSIYVVTRDKTININFRNASYPLVKDFKEMCESVDIPTGKICKTEKISKKTGKKQRAYMTQIQAKIQVKKFIKLIKPEKWKFKKKIIELKLNQLGSTIEDALSKSKS